MKLENYKLTEVSEFLRTLSRHWNILETLHNLKRPVSVTELAEKLEAHISNISKDLQDLQKLNPAVIQFDQEPKETGGRPFKMTYLTEHGRVLVETFSSFKENAQEKPKLKEVDKEELTFLINQITEPRTAETGEAAWIELNGFVKSTRLWKHKQVWSLIEALLSPETPNRESMSALNLLYSLLYHARVELGTNNEVETKVKQECFAVLRQILEKVDVEWRSHRYQVMAIFDYLMADSEKFKESWRIWEKGLGEIKEEGQFTDYLQPVISYITSANLDQKKSVKEKLYQLMQSPELFIRRRALNMHSYLFR